MGTSARGLSKMEGSRESPNLFTSTVPRIREVMASNSASYADWPNAKSSKAVPKDSSLLGAHRVAGNVGPEINFTLAQDYMPALNASTAMQGDGSVMIRWNALQGATGYVAWAFGGMDRGFGGIAGGADIPSFTVRTNVGCGGGCGGGSKSSGEEAARGKLVVATASRVLGAVAAATPTLAHEVIHGTLKSLLDAAKIPREIDGLHSSKAAYLALILATPALGGALDCCERNAESSVHMSVLDDESERLVGLFADAALGKIESPSFDEGIVLGLAGLHMLCKFPYRYISST